MATAVGDDDGVADHNVIYINTSLNTHLAMIVSGSDTVSDFKRKIMLEHHHMFPAIGDIKIECLKVKRKGSFYHLSDSMLVKSAFAVAKGNWFVSVDASCVEQNDGIHQSGKHKDGDQLALPWVTHSRSIERHDNHGSPSVHSKFAPSVSQKALDVDQLTSGDSCKDVSKNVQEDRLCNDKQLEYDPQEKLDNVNTDINSKKRTRDVHNESPLKDASGYGPSVKKKRKTRGKSDVKASEENLALTHDNDKVIDKGASINNDNSFEHRSDGKDLSDENKRNKGENCSVLDQVATVVPRIEGVGSETVGNVAMIVEDNIQQDMSIGMSQKEKGSELVRKPTMENEIHSSLMSTPDCEDDAAGVTAAGHMKRSTKPKAAEKEVSSASTIKKLHNTIKEATESSPQQDVGSNGQECAADQIDKYKDDSEISLKQRPELKLPGRKKGATGCENTGEGKRRKTKKLFKHLDSLVGDICSTVLASVDERKTDEVSEKALVEAKKGDDVIMKEVDISVENMEEKSRKEFTDANDVATETNEENLLPHSESMMNNDADISITGKNTSEVNAQGILDNLEKQNDKTEDTTKKKKKRRTKKRNEDESITKHVNGDICENVEESEKGLPDRKDGDMSSTVLASVIDERKMNEDSEKTSIDAKKGDDVIMKEVEISVENTEEQSRKEVADTDDVATETNEVNLLRHFISTVNNDAGISITGENMSQVNAQGILDNLEKQNEKIEDTMKKKKKRKTKKTAGRNEDESIPKHVNHDICENVKESESGLPDTDRKDGDMTSTVISSVIDERKMNEDSEETLKGAKKGDDVIVEEVGISVENMEEKSRKEITDTNDAVTEENLLPRSKSLVNNDADISAGKNTSEVNVQGILDNLEKQNEKMDDTTKKKKKKKTKRSAGRFDDDSTTKHVDGDIIESVKEVESSLPDADRKGLAGKANKNNKPQDLPSKRQSTEVDLESKKSQSVDHHHLHEKTLKNVTASEVSKVVNEVDIPENESCELDLKDHCAPGHQPKKIASIDNRKDTKKTKVDSRNDQSQKLVSKNENNKESVDVLKDPNITNIDKFKTPKRTKKVDAQKTNRQQSALVQTRAKTVEKKKVNCSPQAKRLLNTPETIFGDGGDSDSSTHTPSGKSSSSSSSSSSGESSYSLYSRRNRACASKGMEGAGKNNINSESKSKGPLMGSLLRSSSSFKKAKVTASSQAEDSQNVDFVPDSQA